MEISLVSGFGRLVHGHGGVALFARSGLMTFPLPFGVVGMSEEVSFEVAGVLCNNIQNITIYRSPRGDFNVYLGRLTHMLETLDLRKSTVVTGDFNVHFHVDGGEAESLCNLFLPMALSGR